METPSSPTVDEHVANRLERVPWYTVPALLLGVPFLISLLVQVRPELFWDHFVWKYYWGPIAADAAGRDLFSDAGVRAQGGYNVVNTLTWAVLLGVCILGVAQILHRFRQPMDTRLIIGATSWVVVGSIWHVLEDTDLLLPPLQYLFITPPIYLLFAAFGVFTFVFGQWLRVIERNASQEQALRQLWLLMMVLVALYTVLWWRAWPQVILYVNPVWAAVAAVATHLLVRYRARKAGHIDPSDLVLTMSLGWYVLGLVYVIRFLEEPWRSVGSNAIPSAVVWAPLLAGLIVLAVYLVARWAAGRSPSPATQAFQRPVNLLIVFAQALDGVATAIGLDLAGYREKHVLSGMVIDGFQGFAESIGWSWGAAYPTFLAFVPLKVGLALVVVYVMDVAGQDEPRNPVVMGIIKFAIIMVGLGPGVRNFLRLSLGV